MDFPASTFWSGLAAIILIDLVLAGDNAIVIALAARNLPRHLQTQAIFWGTLGAIAVRVAMTAVVVTLLRLPGLMLAGGLLLLPIAWKLLRQDDDAHAIKPAAGFWAAMRTIVIADALMGLDNVLAVAGASHGKMSLVVLGLLISVPLVVYGSTLILKLIERFPVVVYLGAAAIAWTAGRMLSHDPLVKDWFVARPWAGYVLELVLVLAICGGAWLAQRRATRAAGTTGVS
ncbi:MAG: TerC family protein [Xanthomonadaceae bacterium]|nr:TerC family protein [Xanthomonadaceae bacterium]MDE1958287.1 TerC family protein [Xanthomonadaceae bacterium]MDE2177011.1 TerC family protein [Xanthomonadaceae bacterium]MDE2245767.1 TerC family protein [Xanthomonadaceae bacterium]